MAETTKQVVIDDGGPAYPCEMDCINEQGHDGIFKPTPGMSYRQWLAGMAMQGIFAGGADFVKTGTVVEDAFYIADAMIAASKTQPDGDK